MDKRIFCVVQYLRWAAFEDCPTFYMKTRFRSEAESYARAGRAVRNRTAGLLNAMSAIHGQDEYKRYKQSNKSKIRA